MQLAAHEFRDLTELIASCYNTVTCMGSFINQAQDPELKSLLQRHYPKHIADYNMKVEFVQSTSTPDINKFQPDDLTAKLDNYLKPPMQIVSAAAPRTDATTHTDREIALAYLLNQKAAAKNYAGATLECANPELRTFLENAFLNSSRHSYEIWQKEATIRLRRPRRKISGWLAACIRSCRSPRYLEASKKTRKPFCSKREGSPVRLPFISSKASIT